VNDIPLMPNAPLAPRTVRTASGETMVYTNEVSRGYFDVLKIPLVEGRDFSVRDDNDDTPVAIINETLARRISRGTSAIGANLEMPDGSRVNVVGVAKDVKYESIDEEPKAFLYRPLPQQPAPSVTFLIRSSREPISVAPGLQSQVRKVGLVLFNVSTL